MFLHNTHRDSGILAFLYTLSTAAVIVGLIGLGAAQGQSPAPAAAAPAPADPAPAAPAASTPEEKYAEDPVDESKKKDSFRIQSLLGSGKLTPAEQQAFDDFYKTYFLARWTSPKNIATLNLRKELRNHLQRAKGQVHDELNALTMEYMGRLVAGNYHPSVRVNAMLVIGELNSVEPQFSEPAVPFPAALPILLAAATNADSPDYLPPAAMVGIRTHAAAGVSNEDARRAITTAMFKIASEELPSGPATVGREWMLGQAIETLGYLGLVGDNNAVFRAIVKPISENKLTLSTRGIAATSLGRLNYANAAGIDPMQTSAALVQYVLDVCVQIQTAAKTNPNNAISRRLLRQPLAAVLKALTGMGDDTHRGIISLARENQRPLLAELQKTIEKAADFLDDRRKEDVDIAPAVEELKTSLEAWLQKKPA